MSDIEDMKNAYFISMTICFIIGIFLIYEGKKRGHDSDIKMGLGFLFMGILPGGNMIIAGLAVSFGLICVLGFTGDKISDFFTKLIKRL